MRTTVTSCGHTSWWPTHNAHTGTHLHRLRRVALGSASPYVDLIDAVTFPPPLYSVAEGTGVRLQEPPVEVPLTLDLKDVFFGGIKKKKIYRQEFVDETRSGTELRERILTVPIRPGIATGCRITFPGEGDRGPLKRPADVVFVVVDRPDPIYRRDGVHLNWTYEVDLLQSLCGFVIDVATVDGRRFLVPIANVVRSVGVMGVG